LNEIFSSDIIFLLKVGLEICIERIDKMAKKFLRKRKLEKFAGYKFCVSKFNEK
jgi:hypothetical protein